MPRSVTELTTAVSGHLHARSAVILRKLETSTDRLALIWFSIVSVACLLRIAVSPAGGVGLAVLAPYLLLVAAPVTTFLLALRWFRSGDDVQHPAFRLARVGRWRDVSPSEARRHQFYGTSGIMVSLLVGMLLNVPVRTAEYLVTMPVISAAAPHWLTTLHLAMTLDTVVLGSLYVVAFAMALRRHAMFPRFLLLVWMIDFASQLLVAQVSAAAGLPSTVAGALQQLLWLNIQKVAISMALWLPYLLLSTRVNVTYRSRIPA